MLDINKIYPLKGQVTQEIIDKAVLSDMFSCIGALTLKQALIDIGFDVTDPKYKPKWGVNIGWVGGTVVCTDTYLSLMAVKEPCEVTFIKECDFKWEKEEKKQFKK